MPADHNALVKYAYTRDHSSIYFRKEDGDFDKISCHENRSTSNFAAVKASASPNFVKVAIVVSVVVVVVAVVAGVTALAVVLSTKDDGVENNKDRQTSETTPPSFGGVSTADSTTESTGLQTSSTSVSGSSTAVPTGPQTTASVTEGSTSQSSAPSISYSWGEWTECTVTCGQGFHTRYRSCNSTVSNCDYVQTDVCEETSCPIIGRWITWSQWGSCNTTCGGGIQTRTRSCSKTSSSDLDCVGENLQKRVCNDWNCPDCSQKCNTGTLNSDCTACVCNDWTVTGRIRSAATGNSISKATIYNSASPTSILGISNATGYFVLTAVCNKSEILITKEGFVNERTILRSSFVEIQMTETVFPFLTLSPQSKSRLTGENVTLCCEAEGIPNITYYEWFKDSVLIDQMEDVNRSQIRLTNLSTQDTGYYQCRANSVIGAVKSVPGKLVVKASPADFCKDALQQKTITLPDDCVQPDTNTSQYEVGECISKSCRSYNSEDKDQCTDDANSCCSPAETRVETVSCKDYSLDIVVIQSCGCGQCVQDDHLIYGVVTSVDNGSPISFCKVLVNGKLKTYTDFDGNYQFFISIYINRITVSLEYWSNQYLPTTKVIYIETNTRDALRVDLKMNKAAEPVIFNSSQVNSLYAGAVSNSTSPKVELKIPANSYYYPNGSLYSGLVKAVFTYLDPSNISNFENIPGVFQYTNEEGEVGNLDTLGVFNLYVEDLNGMQLEITDAVEAYIPDGNVDYENYKTFTLWTLNAQSGVWEALTAQPSSEGQTISKRDTAKLLIGKLTGVSDSKWYNYDKVSKNFNNICFFKICLFQDAFLTKTRNPTYDIYLTTYIKRGSILHTISHYISDPQTYIVNTVCENDQALMIAETYERYKSVTLYVAKPSPSNSANFQISSDEKSLSIVLESQIKSPFHSSRSFSDGSCLNFYYGQTYEEWKYNDKLLGSDVAALCSSSNKPADLYAYWYPYNLKYGHYTVCFVKILVKRARTTFSSSDKVKIRVMSSVPHATDKIVGIIEKEINLATNLEITECIEYRCSGRSDPCVQNVYQTKVKLIIEHNRSGVTFSVEQYSSKLSSAVMNDDKFEFIAPENDDGPSYGVYSRPNAGKDLAYNDAKSYCSSTANGFAATFQAN